MDELMRRLSAADPATTGPDWATGDEGRRVLDAARAEAEGGSADEGPLDPGPSPHRGRLAWYAAAAAAVVVLLVGSVVVAGRGDDTDLTSDGGDPTPAEEPVTGATDAPTTTEAPTTSTVPDTTTSAPEPPRTTATAPPSTTAPPDVLDAGDRLTLRSLGPVEVGMTLAEASAAGGVELPMPWDIWDLLDTSCAGSGPPNLPGVGFLVVGQEPTDELPDARIARITLSEPGVRTLSGIQVGDTVDEVRRVYGAGLVEAPHEYVAGGIYLTLYGQGADSGYGVRFEARYDGVVDQIHAGLVPAIELVEGCA